MLGYAQLSMKKVHLPASVIWMIIYQYVTSDFLAGLGLVLPNAGENEGIYVGF